MKKILVVDDDIDILTVVQLVLDTNGFEVSAISNWQQINPQIEATLETCKDYYHS